MKHLNFCFLLFILPLLTSGQIPNMTRQKAVDSLFMLLKKENSSRKVDLLNQLALNLAPRSFDSSSRFAREALRLSEKLNYSQGKGIATFNLGNSYYFKADIKNALTNYLTALRILEPFEPSGDVGNLLLQLGIVNQYVRNTKKVSAYYKRAASNFAAVGDSVKTMYGLIYLASSYYYTVQTLQSIKPLPPETVNAMMDSALKYNGMVLDYTTRHPNPTWMPDLYNYQGLYLQTKKDTLAPGYFLKSLEAGKILPDTNKRNIRKGLEHLNLGWYYCYHRNDSESGYSHSLLAADLLKNTDRYDLLAGTLLTLGEIDTEWGNYHRAGLYLRQAMNLSDTFLIKIGQIIHTDPGIRIWGVTQIRAWRIEGFKDFVRLYTLTGNYKLALEYQKKQEEEKDMMTLDDLNRQIGGIEADYEDSLKRQEIRGLIRDNELRQLKMNKSKIFFAGLGSVLLIGFLVSVVWIQRKRFSSDQKALILEQKLLRSQMNPHFIFNSLSSIQNFIVTERPDKASIYLSKFAMLVRNILDNSVEEFVVLENEINTIENYLELQKIRYAGKFDYRIKIADEVDPEILKIPPMLAQPFIENAIEHGVKNRETPGHIDIRFSLKDHILLFEVEDDGIGRPKAREIGIILDPKHKSMATSLTIERLANMNRKLNEKIRLEIFDLKNDLDEATGTRVTFGIPVGK